MHLVSNIDFVTETKEMEGLKDSMTSIREEKTGSILQNMRNSYYRHKEHFQIPSHAYYKATNHLN